MTNRTTARPSRLTETLAAIDEVNGADPNRSGGEPLARRQGQAASGWLDRLAPDASPELQMAARGHHLRRWEIVRGDYPEGRAGYLRWRRVNKTHQGDSLATIMHQHGWNAASIERCRTLLSRIGLRSDHETQILEDVACLVFLQTQFDEMAERTVHDRMVSIVGKTLKKMSPSAIALAGQIELSSTARAVLQGAVAGAH